MSQAANTFWDERVERAAEVVRASPVVKRRVRARRLVDAIILTIILAAAGTCVSVYLRARDELGAAQVRYEAADAKLQNLTIKVGKLERDVQQIKTDSRVIELFARQKFGYVRSGEFVIKLIQEQTEPAKIEGARAANLTPRSGDGYTDASN